ASWGSLRLPSPHSATPRRRSDALTRPHLRLRRTRGRILRRAQAAAHCGLAAWWLPWMRCARHRSAALFSAAMPARKRRPAQRHRATPCGRSPNASRPPPDAAPQRVARAARGHTCAPPGRAPGLNRFGEHWMKPYLVATLGLLLAACQPAPTTAPAAPDTDAAAAEAPPSALVDPGHIDAVLGGIVEGDRAVGVSALVYEDGREAYFGAFGQADREAGRPMQRDTLAQIYSMTKPVTGVVLMTLYEEGLFALDDPLSDHLPEYADVLVYAGEDPDGKPLLAAPERPILVRDILRHTAGFAAAFEDDVPARLYREAGVDGRENTLDEMSRRLASVPLAYQPGTRWLYGISVGVQARLAEVLSGEPFARLVRERVLEPLAMHDTGYYVAPGRRGRMAAMYQLREEGGFERLPDSPALDGAYREWPMSPGGYGLVSTLD